MPIACGVVGIIIGIVMGSGLGFRMSSVLIQVSNGHLGILLVLTMVVSLILGMGVPTTAAYLMLALLVVPALKQMNVLPLGGPPVHFLLWNHFQRDSAGGSGGLRGGGSGPLQSHQDGRVCI